MVEPDLVTEGADEDDTSIWCDSDPGDQSAGTTIY